VKWSSAVTIKWDGTGWYSVGRLEDVERTEEWRAEKIASHRIPNANDKNK
jgi:hypothetical protein